MGGIYRIRRHNISLVIQEKIFRLKFAVRAVIQVVGCLVGGNIKKIVEHKVGSACGFYELSLDQNVCHIAWIDSRRPGHSGFRKIKQAAEFFPCSIIGKATDILNNIAAFHNPERLCFRVGFPCSRRVRLLILEGNVNRTLCFDCSRCVKTEGRISFIIVRQRAGKGQNLFRAVDFVLGRVAYNFCFAVRCVILGNNRVERVSLLFRLIAERFGCLCEHIQARFYAHFVESSGFCLVCNGFFSCFNHFHSRCSENESAENHAEREQKTQCFGKMCLSHRDTPLLCC